MSMKTKIQMDAEAMVRGGKASWQTLYNNDDSDAVEILMRCGHIARLYPDYDPANPIHQEALATIGAASKEGCIVFW